ncbi:TetR family transcriptional regulator [Mycobacterium intermedium]|uniref:TetR family transcriptional regulator n=1 Tax=Mycobacterium intermedium TaxID=28445 RepID=A0A1E3SK99_MYCIE|nr:TetR/AcrR family transcriptional regulator [Mycobacterium intermedium]MCV6967149.1 TetR/AcrR family transcriptional regulator [Mycobacterium intermedium]ODR01978.1 TetR family transcriptional regulator [Mycobacterium intermedium]OPE49206.1 TetR family transcriptional regulator [Mycobacterium intermedium]ORA97058.1 TetR family transcriptional regulator [Mycobacterium intermedium]
MPRSPGRRGEILDAFVRYVAERGYDRTNIGDIADELGMSKGTIVHHFGTKAQMLRELEETHLARQLEALRMAWDRLSAPHERIAAIIHTSVLFQVIERNATVASQREVVQLSDDPAMQQVRKLRDQLQEITIDEIRAGVDCGLFRSVNVELAALQLWGSLEWMWVWFNPADSRTPEQVGAAFVDVFLGGLLLDRFELGKWADPAAEFVSVVRDCIAAVTDKAE